MKAADGVTTVGGDPVRFSSAAMEGRSRRRVAALHARHRHHDDGQQGCACGVCSMVSWPTSIPNRHHEQPHGQDARQRHRRQHRPLRQRDDMKSASIFHRRRRDPPTQMEGLMKATKRINIKPQVDKFVYSNGKGPIVLAEGRLLNPGRATGHPSSSCPTPRTRRSRSSSSGRRRTRASTSFAARASTRCTRSPKSSTRRSRRCTHGPGVELGSAEQATTSACLSRDVQAGDAAIRRPWFSLAPAPPSGARVAAPA